MKIYSFHLVRDQKKTNVLNDALICHEKENSKKKQSIKKQLKIQSFHLEQQDQQKKSVE